MPKKNLLDQVVAAAANLKDHGADCMCSMCERDKQLIAQNPDIAKSISRLVP